MVIQRWASLVCNFIGIPRHPPRTKQASSHEDSRLSCVTDDACRGGLSGSVSASLPSLGSPEGEACLCCICLSGLKNAEDVNVLPCKHRFHRHCIDQWFISGSRRRTCPICRFKLDGGRGDAGSCRWEELTEEMAIWFSSFHVAGF